MKTPKRTPEELAAVMTYDPGTGVLKWKRAKYGNGPGEEVGYVNNMGYRAFRLGYEHYLTHRVAFAIHYGYWPTMIDHVNRDRGDNRIVNLREASWLLNGHNSSDQDRSSLVGPARGVARQRRADRFTATIRCNSKQVHLGTFDSVEEASNAYQRAYAERERIYLSGVGADVTEEEAVALMRAAAGYVRKWRPRDRRPLVLNWTVAA